MTKIQFLILVAALTAALPIFGQEKFKVKKSVYTYELIEKNGKCVLNYSKNGVAKELFLDVSSDCKVIRMGANGQVITHYYKDIKATVFMVGGGLSKGNCKVESAASTQTVLISNNVVKAGKTREGACLPDGPDEKEFWLSSH